MLGNMNTKHTNNIQKKIVFIGDKTGKTLILV